MSIDSITDVRMVFMLFENLLHCSVLGRTSSIHLKSGKPVFHSSYFLLSVTPPVIAPPSTKYRNFNAPRTTLDKIYNYTNRINCCMHCAGTQWHTDCPPRESLTERVSCHSYATASNSIVVYFVAKAIGVGAVHFVDKRRLQSMWKNSRGINSIWQLAEMISPVCWNWNERTIRMWKKSIFQFYIILLLFWG